MLDCLLFHWSTCLCSRFLSVPVLQCCHRTGFKNFIRKQSILDFYFNTLAWLTTHVEAWACHTICQQMFEIPNSSLLSSY